MSEPKNVVTYADPDKQIEISNFSLIRRYMRSDIILERFAEVLGDKRARPFVASVLIQVANSPKLQTCTPESIYISAMRAAALKLSVDDVHGEAYLVPYAKVCKFIPGYKGFITLAYRTNKYNWINVTEVYEGEQVVTERISGNIEIVGERTGDKVIGWLAGFELKNGMRRLLYMTKEQIHSHAKRYNPGGYAAQDGSWKKFEESMERKTPLRILLRRWGYMNPADAALVAADDDEDEAINAQFVAPNFDKVIDAEAAKPQPTEAQLMSDLGFGEGPIPINEKEIPASEKVEPQEAPGSPESDENPSDNTLGDWMKPREVKAYLEQLASTRAKAQATDVSRKIFASAIDKVFDGNSGKRYDVCRYLFGKSSSRKINDSYILATLAWMQVDSFDVPPTPQSMKELRAIWTEALVQDGQERLF